VGGYFDLNLEAVVGLRPDLIVMLDEHAANLPALEKLGFATLVVNHQTVDGVLDSLLTLGAAGGVEEAAARLHAELNERRQRVVEQTAGLVRPRVLLVVDRSPGGGIEDCYVAGQEGYFDTMIGWAGGQNACRASLARYPVVSREGIIWMDPEVIVDLSRGLDGSKSNDIGDWQSLGSVSAVRHGRVWSLEAPYAFRPGPRFIVLLERLAEIIHRPAPAAEAAKP
jgi:iron complex transport system substrate-binding protein